MTAALAGTAPVLATFLLAALTAHRDRRPALLRVAVPASGRSRTGR